MNPYARIDTPAGELVDARSTACRGTPPSDEEEGSLGNLAIAASSAPTVGKGCDAVARVRQLDSALRRERWPRPAILFLKKNVTMALKILSR